MIDDSTDSANIENELVYSYLQTDDLTVGEALEKYEETGLQITDLVGDGTEGPHPDVFDARAAVHRWWGSGLRKRRPRFNPNQQEVVVEDLTAELHEIEGSDETGVP
eukprot:Em0001g1303a